MWNVDGIWITGNIVPGDDLLTRNHSSRVRAGLGKLDFYDFLPMRAVINFASSGHEPFLINSYPLQISSPSRDIRPLF